MTSQFHARAVKKPAGPGTELKQAVGVNVERNGRGRRAKSKSFQLRFSYEILFGFVRKYAQFARLSKINTFREKGRVQHCSLAIMAILVTCAVA